MPSTADQIANLDAELDALSTPTTAQVLAHTQDYDADVVAASAAQRAINGGGGGGGGGVQILDSGWVHVTSAEIKALNTPKTLVAAPASGEVLVPFRAVAVYTFVTTAYDNLFQMGVNWATNAPTDIGNGLTLIDLNILDLLSETVDSIISSSKAPATEDDPFPVATADGSALVLVTDGNPTLGDGTLDVKVFYTVETLP